MLASVHVIESFAPFHTLDLARFSPDEKGTLKMAKLRPGMPLAAAMESLEYSDSALLLPMWLCLIQSKGVLNQALSKLYADKRELQDRFVAFYKENKHAPHPETLVSSFYR